MPAAINFVCTRCTDANHALLERWYNDHAQLLMASPQLHSAELFRLDKQSASMDYFCLYHFAQLSDFSAFDSGEVMANVRDLSNQAPGRGSIEIVKRTQYERLLHRVWSQHAGAVQACLLYVQQSGPQQVMRWLNDVVYGLHLSHGVQAAQVYAAQTEPSREILVLLHMQENELLPADWHMQTSSYAARPELALIWQAQAKRIGQWCR